MNTDLSPVRTLTRDPELHRHLSGAERTSLRFAVWLLELHLRRAQVRRRAASAHAEDPRAEARREAARLAHENRRALERRLQDAQAAAFWHLGRR